MSLSKLVAKLRLHYHANMVELNNVLNQLHLRSDRKAEKIARKHVAIVLIDIAPRLND